MIRRLRERAIGSQKGKKKTLLVNSIGHFVCDGFCFNHFIIIIVFLSFDEIIIILGWFEVKSFSQAGLVNFIWILVPFKNGKRKKKKDKRIEKLGGLKSRRQKEEEKRKKEVKIMYLLSVTCYI